MNGITTVPHLSEKAVALVQMGAQAFIFLTIALTISELLNIFNLIYQRNQNLETSRLKVTCNSLNSLFLLFAD